MMRRPISGAWVAVLLGLLSALPPGQAATAAAPPPSAGPPGPPTTLPRDPEHPPLKLAILVFPGVEVIDLGGPYEVFTEASWGRGALFDVYTVAPKPGPFETKPSWGGLTLTPDYTIANAPRPDILVVPGGNIVGTYKDAAVQQWIKSTADSAQYVMSVCNGAYFLGASGLLDGLKATTAAPLIDGLKGVAPTCQPVYDRRVVDNGKIITTAGLSAGIDGALHLVEKIAGHDIAFLTALNMEYNWQPKGDYARAALADRWLRAMLGRNGFDFAGKVEGWRAVHQEGDRTTWTKAWEFRSTAAPESLMADVDRKLGETWQKQPTAAPNVKATANVTTTTNGGPTTSRWAFRDADGNRWSATANLRPPAGAAAPYGLVIRLDKVGARPTAAPAAHRKRAPARRRHRR